MNCNSATRHECWQNHVKELEEAADEWKDTLTRVITVSMGLWNEDEDVFWVYVLTCEKPRSIPNSGSHSSFYDRSEKWVQDSIWIVLT